VVETRRSALRPPTLEVVAARAGVSRATASRVLRGSTKVSEQARRSVLDAAREMAYTPNRAARSLVTRRSESVAFLVAESEDRLFSDPFFLGMLRGAQTQIASAGLQLIFVIASSPTEAEQFEHYAGSGHVDGVLLLSLHGDDRLPRHLETIGVPTVLSGRPFTLIDSLYYVDSDNSAGGQLAAQLLVDRGARRIGTITGPLDMTAAQDRLGGFRAGLAATGRRAPPRLITHGDFTADGGERAMRRLLAANPDIDAVFVASDLMAIGAIRAIQESGRTVPDDVAVVGFDDIREGQVATPALTTVRQSLDDMGRTMARILLDRIEERPTERFQILPVHTVRRASA
jgi:DNA-binding LacI/PurR family transcriptional regulator